jgi:hypothetical protein
MSKRTKKLESHWWDWLSTAERLQLSLYEQTAALTMRDVERLEKLQPEIDNLMIRMDDIDDEATAVAKGLAEELGAEPNLRSLVTVLEKKEGEEVQALANRVIVVGRNIQKVIGKNRRLIEEELQYVNGTMALIAKAATDEEKSYQAKKAKKTESSAAVIMNQVA